LRRKQPAAQSNPIRCSETRPPVPTATLQAAIETQPPPRAQSATPRRPLLGIRRHDPSPVLGPRNRAVAPAHNRAAISHALRSGARAIQQNAAKSFQLPTVAEIHQLVVRAACIHHCSETYRRKFVAFSDRPFSYRMSSFANCNLTAH
jgi:hypothetical protein